MTYRDEGGDNHAIKINSVIDTMLTANHLKARVVSLDEKELIADRIKEMGWNQEDIVCHFYDALPNIIAKRQGAMASRGRRFLEKSCKGDFEFFRANVKDAENHRIKVNAVEHVCLNNLTKQDFEDISISEEEELEVKKHKTSQSKKMFSLLSKDMTDGQLFFDLSVDGIYMFGDPTAGD